MFSLTPPLLESEVLYLINYIIVVTIVWGANMKTVAREKEWGTVAIGVDVIK